MCLHASEQWHSEVCGCCGADYLAVNPAAGFLAEEATAKELRKLRKGERERERQLQGKSLGIPHVCRLFCIICNPVCLLASGCAGLRRYMNRKTRTLHVLMMRA